MGKWQASHSFSANKRPTDTPEPEAMWADFPLAKEEVHTWNHQPRSKLQSFIWARSLVQTHLLCPLRAGVSTVFIPIRLRPYAVALGTGRFTPQILLARGGDLGGF